MDSWVPLFEIFLSSPCPETEASLWLQKSFSSSSSTTTISTTSFLSLLTKPSESTGIDLSSIPQEKRIMWIRTLPDIVQARILSFLAYDHQRFCKKDLCKLARVMLSECLDFWVKKAAQQLLDVVSVSNYQWLSHLNLESEEENVEDEFHSVPDWLRNATGDNEPMFPWLPMLPDETSEIMFFRESEDNGEDSFVDVEDREHEDIDEVMEEVVVEKLNIDDPLDSDIENKAKSLKAVVLDLDSASIAEKLGDEIRELCNGSRGNCLAVLQLIEPWHADDELAAVLISNFSSSNQGDELGWPSYVLCSVVLPKFLTLMEPPSRVLMAATIEYCKTHQRSAENALLFPLILRMEGINSPICDVISRIVKECLHPAHVSAFCHKLLCEDKDSQKFVCLPCHRHLIGDELVCTESLFGLLLNILNHNVYLTQDSVDQLVCLVSKCTDRYSKSLKFGSFLLCLVNKCSPLLKPHKVLLIAAVENTNTLITKSILARLSGL